MAIIAGYDEAKIYGYVMDTWTKLKRARKFKQEVWTECLKAYMRYHNDEKWVVSAKQKGYSHRYFAATWDAAENLAATIGQAVWRYPEWLSLEPAPHVEDEVDYDDTVAEQLAEALKYNFRIDGCHRKCKQLIKTMALCGNAPFSVLWKREPATDYPAYIEAMEAYQEESQREWQMFQYEVAQWQMMAQQAQQLGEAPPTKPHFNTPNPPIVDPEFVFNSPTLICEDLFNFVIDQPGFVDRPIRIKRVIKPKAWLQRHSQRQEDGYILYENLDRVQDADLQPQSGSESDERGFRAEIFGMEAMPERGIELFEMQGDMIFAANDQSGDSVFMSYIATVSGGGVVHRFEPLYLASGRCPTQMAKMIDIPGEAYGMGLIEAALPIQDLLNKRMNQVVDAVSVVTDPEVKVWDDGVYDLATKSGPGKKHLVGDPNNIQPIHKQTTGIQIAMADVQMALRWFQQLTRSANPYVDTASESTATEVQRNEGLKSVAFNDLVESAESQLIAPIFDLFIDHNAQYASAGVMALITQSGQKRWMKVSPEALRRGWLVKPMGSKRASDEQRRMQNLLMFIELVTGNPVIMQLALGTNMVNIPELLKAFYKETDLGGEEKIFNDIDPAEVKAFMLQQAIMEAQGASTGQDGGGGGQGQGSGGQGQAGAPAGMGADALGLLTQSFGGSFGQ